MTLTGSKATLHLLDPALVGNSLTAQGYISPIKARKGRVYRHQGRRYRLLTGLQAGVRVKPLSLTEPIVLEAV